MNNDEPLPGHLSEMSLPTLRQRKTLPHTPPPWVGEDALFFITVCMQPRGINHLCHRELADQLYESVRYREELGQWWVPLFLLMPDHLHMLVGFAEGSGMQKTMSSWKRYTARQFGVQWQRDFFDHRIRSPQSLEQKATYIRQNPVRAGLVETPEAWEFVWPR